jgi:peptide/nickel transport system substrate-binding protein
MDELRFRVLGPLEVAAGTRVLTLGGTKQRLLLGVLLLHPNELVSRDQLIDDLWVGRAPPGAGHNLEVYVSRLRKVLRPYSGSDTPLLTKPGGYLLQLEPGQLDVGDFESLYARGRRELARGDAAGAAATLAEALSLWRGAPLADLASEPFARVEIDRLEELRLAAIELRIEAELALGRHATLISELEALVARKPLREALRGQLMLALYRSGRQADALELYQRTRMEFVGQLGLEPGQDLQRLEQSILRQDPQLDREPTPGEKADPDAAVATPAADRDDEPAKPASRTLLPRRRSQAIALVGVIVAGATAVTAFLLLSGTSESSNRAAIPAGSVGFIQARGDEVRTQVPVEASPTSVAFGERSIWVANANADTVSRVDPRTGSVVQVIRVGHSPSGITVGGGGVWVANHDDDTLSWINPQSNTEVRQIPVGSGPTAVAYGFGSVWVTNADDRSVSRIHPMSGALMKVIQTDAVGRGIAVGGGFVWVTDESTRSVVQIDPATNEVEGRPTVGTGPVGIAYGAGSVWVANALDNTVSQIDATTLTVRGVTRVAGGPSAVAFGDGSVWVSAEFGARVVRIDPRRGTIAGSIPIGNRPEGLAAGDGGVWVAVQSSGQGHQGGRLVVLGSGLDSIDPAIENTSTASTVLAAVYDGLTNTRRVGGSAGTQLVPDLATTLPEAADGGRSYTFHLRPGIRYSNGTPLRAADFRRAFERELVLGGPWAGELSKLVGAGQCKPRRPCNLSRGVIVNGPSTLTLRLSAPDPRLLFHLAAHVPVPAGTPLRDVGTTPLPSTGAYEIRGYAPGRLVTLVRNHYFHVWSAAARPDGYPDEIVYRVLTNGDQAVHDVLAGKADLLYAVVPTRRVAELAARYPRQLHVVPQLATWFLFLNVQRPPFDDIRVRRALNYAVDRARLTMLHGGPLLAHPTCQLIPPTVPGYTPYCPYTINPDSSGTWKAPALAKARALIAASKPQGQPVVVRAFGNWRGEGEYIVALLRQLGYRARLLYIHDLARSAAALKKTPGAQAGIFGWFGSPVAVDMLSTVGCRFGWTNAAHFCDRRIDAQVAALGRQQPSPAAAKLAARIDREIVDRAPWVPLLTPRSVNLTSSRVGNHQASPYGFPLLEQMWIRKQAREPTERNG